MGQSCGDGGRSGGPATIRDAIIVYKIVFLSIDSAQTHLVFSYHDERGAFACIWRGIHRMLPIAGNPPLRFIRDLRAQGGGRQEGERHENKQHHTVRGLRGGTRASTDRIGHGRDMDGRDAVNQLVHDQQLGERRGGLRAGGNRHLRELRQQHAGQPERFRIDNRKHARAVATALKPSRETLSCRILKVGQGRRIRR